MSSISELRRISIGSTHMVFGFSAWKKHFSSPSRRSIKLFPSQTSILPNKTSLSISLSLPQAMDSSAEPNTSQEHQNVVVMRHGDRMDNFEPLWVATAKRPWDPPLFEAGRVRAFCKGRRIRTQLGFPIHRVFVSPFLRCVQTAFQAISALCAVDDSPNALTADEVSIDPSKVKVIYDSRISKNWPMIFIFLQVFINSKLIFIPTSSLFCMKISP
jgi:hypothetical protein